MAQRCVAYSYVSLSLSFFILYYHCFTFMFCFSTTQVTETLLIIARKYQGEKSVCEISRKILRSFVESFLLIFRCNRRASLRKMWINHETKTFLPHKTYQWIAITSDCTVDEFAIEMHNRKNIFHRLFTAGSH